MDAGGVEATGSPFELISPCCLDIDDVNMQFELAMYTPRDQRNEEEKR